MLIYFFVSFQAILAAVVIANLIGLLRQFSRLRDLWKIHRPDAVRYSYFLHLKNYKYLPANLFSFCFTCFNAVLKES